MEQYKDLIHKAFFGDPDGKRQLMLIAKELLDSGQFESAALMYKEAANCYRVGEMRAELNPGKRNDEDLWLKRELDLINRWISTHPNGFVSLPVNSLAITADELWELVLNKRRLGRDCEDVLYFLEKSLAEFGATVGSQGYSVERLAYQLLTYYFGLHGSECPASLSSFRVRIASDLLADLIATASEPGSNSDSGMG